MSIPLLIGLAVLAGGLGWLAQVALTATGNPTIVPPSTLAVGLVVIGALVVGFGWPIRQFVRGRGRRPVDPFVAMRVLLLARAASIIGALLLGGGLGVLAYDLSRTVPAPGSTIVVVVLEAVGALLMTIAGLVVESWCRIPPSDDVEPEPARGLQRH